MYSRGCRRGTWLRNAQTADLYRHAGPMSPWGKRGVISPKTVSRAFADLLADDYSLMWSCFRIAGNYPEPAAWYCDDFLGRTKPMLRVIRTGQRSIEFAEPSLPASL